MSPAQQPRLQSARWPGLGASSSGSLCESANPREERRGLVLGRPVRSTEQSFQDDLLDSSVSCESATDEKFGRRKARRAVGSATFFLLFFTRFRGKKKGQPDNAALQACHCGPAVYVCVIWIGAGSGWRPGSGQGARLLGPGCCTLRVHLIDQPSLINSRQETGGGAIVVVGQQLRSKAGVVERGGRGQGGFVNSSWTMEAGSDGVTSIGLMAALIPWLRKVDRCGARQLRCSVM